jgi:hypothetical protein
MSQTNRERFRFDSAAAGLTAHQTGRIASVVHVGRNYSGCSKSDIYRALLAESDELWTAVLSALRAASEAKAIGARLHRAQVGKTEAVR